MAGVVFLMVAAGMVYFYLAGQPVTVFVHSNLANESLLVDGIDISSAPGTGRNGGTFAGAPFYSDWYFKTTRSMHVVELTHPNAQPSTITFSPGILEKTHELQIPLTPSTYKQAFQVNPADADVEVTEPELGTQMRPSRRQDGIVEFTLMAGIHPVKVSKAGYPDMAVDIRVPNVGGPIVLDMVAVKQQQEAQQQQQISIRLANANALFQQQQYDQAVAECDGILQMDPSNGDAAKLKSQIEQTKSVLGGR